MPPTNNHLHLVGSCSSFQSQHHFHCLTEALSCPHPVGGFTPSPLLSRSCVSLALCNPMNCSTPGLPVHHWLPESTQTHVHWVSDAIQPSRPLSSPSPPAFSLSQYQGLFQWVGSLHQVVLELRLQHQSLQWIFRADVSPFKALTTDADLLTFVLSDLSCLHLGVWALLTLQLGQHLLDSALNP